MDASSTGALSFHNISYVLGETRMNAQCKKCYPPCIKPKPDKQILNDVSGIFKTGMNAIMGKCRFLDFFLREKNDSIFVYPSLSSTCKVDC
jgi:hypothetical protein